METQKFHTTVREVEAVQVTDANMIELAQWCGGRTEMEDGVPFVRIRAQRGTPQKFTKAPEGFWIVKLNHSFRVYPEDSFVRSFDPAIRDDVGTPLYDAIVAELKQAKVTQAPVETTAEKLHRLMEMHNVEPRTPTEVMGRPYVPATTEQALPTAIPILDGEAVTVSEAQETFDELLTQDHKENV